MTGFNIYDPTKMRVIADNNYYDDSAIRYSEQLYETMYPYKKYIGKYYKYTHMSGVTEYVKVLSGSNDNDDEYEIKLNLLSVKDNPSKKGFDYNKCIEYSYIRISKKGFEEIYKNIDDKEFLQAYNKISKELIHNIKQTITLL